jgi:uncharacterized protein YdeI (YjbR/CyaY-like superfamily)
MNPAVDDVFKKAEKWREELEKLRAILLGCGLTEELKWGKPCYTFEQKNVAIIYGFKENCAVGFFKGALLKDDHGVLIQPGENSQAMRFVKFSSLDEINAMETTLKTYIHEAIEVEKAGLQVDFKKSTEFIIPEEFQNRLDESPALKTAFEALTPGRQRAYVLYFSEPRQEKTRQARVEKYVQQILDGKGLNDYH